VLTFSTTAEQITDPRADGLPTTSHGSSGSFSTRATSHFSTVSRWTSSVRWVTIAQKLKTTLTLTGLVNPASGFASYGLEGARA